MKTITNKSVDLNAPHIPNAPTCYAGLIEACLNQTPQGGFTYEDIKLRQRIEHACVKGISKFNLEDADHAKLVELVKSMRWLVRSEAIVQFTDDILNAK